MAGIYVAKGMTLSLSNLSISIHDDGRIEALPLALNVRFDVCPSWLQIAKRHLAEAVVARQRRELAWSGGNEEAKSQALEQEFESSMQAIMASAIAIDAFYSIVQQHVSLPTAIVERWRANRTARYSQVTEVIKRAFSLKQVQMPLLRSNIKELYRFRDLAVHPSGKIGEPVLHPELNVGTEWRFGCFRAANAEIAVVLAARILWELANKGKATDENLKQYQHSLVARLLEVYPSGPPTLPTFATK